MQYDSCPTTHICLDVEFLANVEGLHIYGMNVRFFYDYNTLEFNYFTDFQDVYDSSGTQIITGDANSGSYFGFSGPITWVNSFVQGSNSSIAISTDPNAWTKLFSVCFDLRNVSQNELVDFCPSVIWDLQYDPSMGGFFPGDDGVVITYEDPPGSGNEVPVIENVVQFNWAYDPSGNQFGFPQSIDCITTHCWQTPISDWAIYLGIGLMIIMSIFIYKRRMS